MHRVNIEYPYLHIRSKHIVKRIYKCPILAGECKQRECVKFSDYYEYSDEERAILLAADNPDGCFYGDKIEHCTLFRKPVSMIELI